MKPITVNVSETIYQDFQRYARAHDRKTSELIREAMEAFWRDRISPKRSLSELSPLSLGSVKQPFSGDDDLLGEMVDG